MRPSRHGRGWQTSAAVVLAAVLASPLAAVLADTVEVRFEGVSGDLAENARNGTALARLASRDDLSEAVIRRLYRRAPEDIARALRPFGHYEATVEGQLERTGDQQWRATFRIAPGEPVRLDEVSVDVVGPGADHPAFRAALADHPLVPGAELRHADYEALKKTLRRVAAERGFPDARFTHNELRVDPAAGEADVLLTLESGPQYYFGEVRIEQDAISEDLARRFVQIEPGTPYSSEALLDAQFALRDSGYFSTVQVETRRTETVDRHIPIVVTGTARTRQRYTLGVGYATDVGPRTRAGWNNSRVNTRGHRASADLRVSAPVQELTARYAVPFGDPRTEHYALLASIVSEELGTDADSNRQEIELNQTRVRGEWQRNRFLRLTREITRTGPERLSDTLVVPGMSLSRTRADRVINPRKASRVTAELRGSSPLLAARTTFLRFDLETRLVRPLGRGRLLLRADFGTVFVDEVTDLPGSQRFFAGGDRSVRGFSYDELGPRNADGRTVGGEHMVAASAEIEWPVAGRWSAAFFLDAGNAFDEFGDALEYSVGVGARLLTPIGMIRVDVAKPVSLGDRKLRLHLGLGADL